MKKKLFAAVLCAFAGLTLASCAGKDYSHTIRFGIQWVTIYKKF